MDSNQNRLTGTDWPGDIVRKMGGSNIGSLHVVGVMLHAQAERQVRQLDLLGIYDGDIYVLYNNICAGNLSHMLAVIDACLLGLFDGSILKDACSRQDYSGKQMVPVAELYEKVRIHFQSQ